MATGQLLLWADLVFRGLDYLTRMRDLRQRIDAGEDVMAELESLKAQNEASAAAWHAADANEEPSP